MIDKTIKLQFNHNRNDFCVRINYDEKFQGMGSEHPVDYPVVSLDYQEWCHILEAMTFMKYRHIRDMEIRFLDKEDKE